MSDAVSHTLLSAFSLNLSPDHPQKAKENKESAGVKCSETARDHWQM